MKQFIELTIKNSNSKILVNLSYVRLVREEFGGLFVSIEMFDCNTKYFHILDVVESYDEVIAKIKEVYEI